MLLLILKKIYFLIDGVEELIHQFHDQGKQMILASSASKVTIERVLIVLI